MNEPIPPSEMRPLDILAPLATGTTLLEASAGTGKTWTLTSVIARLVAEEGIAITRVLALTFTRAAAAELQGRTRERLVETRDALRRARQGAAATEAEGKHAEKDKVLHHIAHGSTEAPLDQATRNTRLARVERALQDLDSSHISTIHSFCQETGQTNAFVLGQSFGVALVDEANEALGDLVDDWLLGAQAHASADAAVALASDQRLTEATLRSLAQTVRRWPDAVVLPPPRRRDRAAVRARVEAVVVAFSEAWRSGLREEVTAQLCAAAQAGTFATKTLGYKSKGKLYAAHAQAVAHLDKVLDLIDDGDGATDAAARQLASSPHSRATLTALLAPRQSLPDTPELARFLSLVEEASTLLGESQRADFLAFLAEEFPRRQRLAREVSFEDLLSEVRAGVRAAPATSGTSGTSGAPSPSSGPSASPAAVALRAQFDVVLVDEFQDTDGVQWDIFRETFVGSPRHFVFLVGDPKQAIYAFRGADVRVYESARERTEPGRRATLDANFRSDGRLVVALDVLFRDRGPLFEEDSPRYVPMHAATNRHPATSLAAPDPQTVPAPLRFRWFDRQTWDRRANGRNLGKGEANAWVPALVAADIVKLLARGLQLRPNEERPRPLQAGDIAVLVRKNSQASAIRDALVARGIPAVTPETGSVFQSEEASWLLGWLQALVRPAQTTALAHALSPLGGFNVEDLHAATRGQLEAPEAASERWLSFLADLERERELFTTKGCAVAFGHALGRDQGAPIRELAERRGGERSLTNLRHLEELLHRESEAVGPRLTRNPAAFVRHLVARRDGEGDNESAELRLESDRAAVRVTTVHKSKGLEYPVVFVPYAWDGALLGKNNKELVFHPATATGGASAQVVVDLRTNREAEAETRARSEAIAENMRLLYVALTRARHHLVVYTGPVLSRSNTQLKEACDQDGGFATSALGILLHGGRDPSAAPGTRAQLAGRTITEHLRGGRVEPFRETINELVERAEAARLAEGGPGAIIEWCEEPLDETAETQSSSPAPLPDAPRPESLFCAPFSRGHELAQTSPYQRASYTSLTRSAHAAPSGARDAAAIDDQPDEDAGGDEIGDASLGPEPVADLSGAVDVPLARFQRGPDAGTFVHELLEVLDFQTKRERPPLDAADEPAHDGLPLRELPQLAREEAQRRGIAETEAELLAAALPTILDTPLGEAAGGQRLADLTTSRRLDELAFDLSVVGGHAFRDDTASVSGRTLAACLAAPRLPDEPPQPWSAAYTQKLRAGMVQIPDFAGFLTGSLDLVYQAGEGDDARYFVADYKTNWVGERDEDGVYRSTVLHYTRPWLIAEMIKHHYFIQAHLYAVALHRLLRLRLGESYSYDRHFGGCVYLFLRGLGAGRGPTDRPSEAVPGVFVDRPPRRIIEALDRLLATGSWPQAGVG
jgi:exodeoxyribonuclease V beta subunit